MSSNTDFDPNDFGQASDLMESVAGNLKGISLDGAELVGKLSLMLDAALRKIAQIPALLDDHSELTNQARNIAEAIQMHGTKVGGPRHVRLLLDLCNVIDGRSIRQPGAKPKKEKPEPAEIPADALTVQQAMRMLGCEYQQHLADKIGVNVRTIGIWRDEHGGVIPKKWADKVRILAKCQPDPVVMVGEVAA